MDVVTFGESMVVLAPNSNGPLRHINTFTKSLGGAESNFAIAVSRLNHSIGWFSKISNDEFGKFILNTIRSEGVDTSRVIVDRENSCGLLFKRNVTKVKIRMCIILEKIQQQAI